MLHRNRVRLLVVTDCVGSNPTLSTRSDVLFVRTQLTDFFFAYVSLMSVTQLGISKQMRMPLHHICKVIIITVTFTISLTV